MSLVTFKGEGEGEENEEKSMGYIHSRNGGIVSFSRSEKRMMRFSLSGCLGVWVCEGKQRGPVVEGLVLYLGGVLVGGEDTCRLSCL